MKKTKRSLKKTLLLVLMFVLMLGATVTTYAYWVSSVTGDTKIENNDNEIGRAHV